MEDKHRSAYTLLPSRRDERCRGHHSGIWHLPQRHLRFGSSDAGSQLQEAPPSSLSQPGSHKHLTSTTGMDGDRSVVSHTVLTPSCSPGNMLACPLKIKLTLSTWNMGRGLSLCGVTLLEGFVKERFCLGALTNVRP